MFIRHGLTKAFWRPQPALSALRPHPSATQFSPTGSKIPSLLLHEIRMEGRDLEISKVQGQTSLTHLPGAAPILCHTSFLHKQGH